MADNSNEQRRSRNVESKTVLKSSDSSTSHRERTVFTLVKIAYCFCSEDEKRLYDNTNAPAVDIKECCAALIKALNVDKISRKKGHVINDKKRTTISGYGVGQFAAQNGHLDCLKMILENEGPWDEGVCFAAALNGQLECLKYARENGCSWDDNVTCGAAAKGHLDCLKYAHENGCPWEEDLCMNAASNGHLECLKYAHENGCPWDEDTRHWAAKNGHLDCLQYASENGCPLHSDMSFTTSLNGQLLRIIIAE